MVFTGHRRETRRLVVAISLSGSAVNFSLTARKKTTQIKNKNYNCEVQSVQNADLFYKTTNRNQYKDMEENVSDAHFLQRISKGKWRLSRKL